MKFVWAGLLSLCLLLGSTETMADFEDVLYNVKYIYHEKHALLLTRVEDTNSCYFTHVDTHTKSALENCHRNFLEMELYEQISWEDPQKLQPSSLDNVRQMYGDLLADFMCSNSRIFTLNFTVGLSYISTCADMVGR
ncbi:uncharacterized protein LOC143300144 [Babylonia areolata]|uniref:uncharacterized protein LOC143300144 n=1 Tax=Babylonia areolata TaxID=304850 RepID=UPI003FD31BEA